MNFHFRLKYVTFVLFLCLGWTANSAYAYNRDSHQHITELAYSYLKLMDMCQPVKIDNTQACESECKEELLGQNLQRGYTCSCLDDFCGEAGLKCSQYERDGFSQYTCTQTCVADEDSQVQQCIQDASCSAPYYFHDDWGVPIIEDACRRKCLDSTTSELETTPKIDVSSYILGTVKK